jgi:DamX protein
LFSGFEKDLTLMALPSDNNTPRQPDVAGFLHRDASGDSPLLPDKTDAANADEQRMQMMQSSLVERIADVDDERRRSAAQLQRALQTHSAETTDYVRRRWQSLLIVVGVTILLAAAIVGYLQLRVEQRLGEMLVAFGQLEQRVAAVEATPDSPPDGVESAQQQEISEVRFQVERLGERVAGLTKRVARLANDSARTEVSSLQPAASSAAVVEPSAKAQTAHSPTEPDQASAPETRAPAADAGERDIHMDAASIARAVLEQAGEFMASEQVRIPEQADESSGPQIGSDVAAAPEPSNAQEAATAATVDALVDALIEDPAGDEAREYQRLALRVAAPAVRSRDGVDQAPGDGTGSLAAETTQSPTDAEQAPPSDDPDAGGAGDDGLTEKSPQQGRIQLGDRRIVLQLIGFFSRDLMDAFIERSSLPPQVYSMRETFRGRPWFVLIHSLYPDRAAAREAVASLPPDLAQLDLWVRELPRDTELEVIATRASDD